MKKFLLIILVCLTVAGYSQMAQPKLVVGVIIDQMRYDYLERFAAHYSEGGFLRLINQGYNCRNLQYNYVPTVTAVGHASVYTGTTPRSHGIIGNNWFDKKSGRMVYCVEDRSVKSVGVETNEGQMSPHNLIASTFGDQLKLHNSGKSRVIGISLKDRGSVLPAGRMADAAYWFSDRWITSSYYMDALPDWVNKFNKDVRKYMPDKWETIRPIESYVESYADDNDFEGKFSGEERPIFPHEIKKLAAENGDLGMLKLLPHGSTLTTDFAKATILNEKLGMGAYTDLLTISYSSPDNTGHFYGPHSKEMQDTYVRMDGEIASLLSFLDREIGSGNYLLFLTADHAASEVPGYLNSLKAPGGIIDYALMNSAAQDFLNERFGLQNAIRKYYNEQFFLDYDVIEQSGHDVEQVARTLARFVMQFEGIAEAHSTFDLMRTEFTEGVMGRTQRGINMQRSGDVVVTYQPSWMIHWNFGTEHGSGYACDTHVPGIFFGWGVKSGYSDKPLAPIDIAPTICTMLGISFPNATQGQPIEDLLKE